MLWNPGVFGNSGTFLVLSEQKFNTTQRLAVENSSCPCWAQSTDCNVENDLPGDSFDKSGSMRKRKREREKIILWQLNLYKCGATSGLFFFFY